MAKKAGQQALQAEINTDEDLENILQKPGLVLIDVYSEWCGPCISMIPTLKKIKFEAAGDFLTLAIAKSDTVTPFKRFNRKSEATWLFFVNKRAVNIAFGCRTPKLVKLILTELTMINMKNRKSYAPHELLPVEEEKFQAIENERLANEARIAAEKEKQRYDYLTFVTDSIMENLSDVAVTIYGTHATRDMYKLLVQPAEQLKLQCKERRFTTISKEDFDVINFECPNPLPQDVQDYLAENEVLVCYWKLPEGANFGVLNEYLTELKKPRQVKEPDSDKMKKIPPILKDTKIRLEFELAEDEFWEEPEDVSTIESKDEDDEKDEEVKSEAEEEKVEEEFEEEEEEAEQAQSAQPDFSMPMDSAMDDTEPLIGDHESETEPPEPVKRYRIQKIRMPAMWIPQNHRTHAAAIYTLFKSQTTPFLPPDPIPDPPHIIMIFPAHKRQDVVSTIVRNKEHIKNYGFFTSEEPSEAKHIASSMAKYEKCPHRNFNDKLVVRVDKETSHMMLNLASYNPVYVSPNTTVGAEEAKLFFTEELAEQEAAAAAAAAEEAAGKGQPVAPPHEEIEVMPEPIAEPTPETDAEPEATETPGTEDAGQETETTEQPPPTDSEVPTGQQEADSV